MANKHCYMHNAVVSRDMHGVKGHVHDCEVGSRWQRRKKDTISHEGLLKGAGGPSNIEFGGFIPDEEAYAMIKRRPGSESKLRELSGNYIFEGPYPLKEDCGGVGSNMTGRCPPVNLWLFSGRLQVPKPASSRATIYSRLSQTHTTRPHLRHFAPLSLKRHLFRQISCVEIQPSCQAISI